MKNQETESIGKWISILYRQTQIYLNGQMKPYGLNYSEYISLVNLSPESDGNNQKHLSDILIIDGALTTRAMKSLEKKGFILREKSKNDKRANSVSLTKKGIEMQPVILRVLKDWTNIISNGMNEEEKEFIIQRLKSMANNALKENKRE